MKNNKLSEGLNQVIYDIVKLRKNTDTPEAKQFFNKLNNIEPIEENLIKIKDIFFNEYGHIIKYLKEDYITMIYEHSKSFFKIANKNNNIQNKQIFTLTAVLMYSGFLLNNETKFLETYQGLIKKLNEMGKGFLSYLKTFVVMCIFLASFLQYTEIQLISTDNATLMDLQITAINKLMFFRIPTNIILDPKGNRSDEGYEKYLKSQFIIMIISVCYLLYTIIIDTYIKYKTNKTKKNIQQQGDVIENIQIFSQNKLSEDTNSLLIFLEKIRKKHDTPQARQFFTEINYLQPTQKNLKEAQKIFFKYYPDYNKADTKYQEYVYTNAEILFVNMLNSIKNSNDNLAIPKDYQKEAFIVCACILYCGFIINNETMFFDLMNSIRKKSQNLFKQGLESLSFFHSLLYILRLIYRFIMTFITGNEYLKTKTDIYLIIFVVSSFLYTFYESIRGQKISNTISSYGDIISN